MLRANGYTMVQHFRLFSISFLSFFFSFLLLLLFFFFLVGGFGFVLLISLRRILLGHRADGCPAPGQGLPMNVRLKSPAKGGVRSAGHGLWRRGRPSDLEMCLSKVDTTEQGMY